MKYLYFGHKDNLFVNTSTCCSGANLGLLRSVFRSAISIFSPQTTTCVCTNKIIVLQSHISLEILIYSLEKFFEGKLLFNFISSQNFLESLICHFIFVQVHKKIYRQSFFSKVTMEFFLF
jgi:hypothetical protein